ncbi:DUF4350 domain-containing protein [Terrimonas sp. NA20]|uniref:DUF4350 domain-containing protein n=1 Tax=Terrimonas ginsenosidimutans TaxID=2908004 RepID=A0ABS9KTR2_9BACT|nr:DUF4350 domain-containing protein [Terrimonas ginsenosidimutans]MCG2615690.1 DUF4350 domain-containing protein [Terrimonas ginsenosidimutans]
MKKTFPYLLMAVVLAAVLFLIYKGDRGVKEQRTLDRRMSFRIRDKIPYGTYVAYQSLQRLFPEATISTDKNRPGEWQTLTPYQKRQALVIISPFFNAEQSDIDNLLEFVKEGNDVFVSAMKVSYYVEKLLKCDIYYPSGVIESGWQMNGNDTLSVSLDVPAQNQPHEYSYPGQRYDFWFYKYDTLTSSVLGYNKEGKPNFVRLKAGKGNFYLQLAPMAFTNYFLLHKKNMEYYDRSLSLLSPDTKAIVWDEFYVLKGDTSERDKDDSKPNWLSVFFSYPSLRWAMITAIIALVVYVLMEMRRKQRPIPVIHPPKNDSLDFVKTIGRLYHDKGDHRNLCIKMGAYFLEHVRMRYKLSTTTLDDEFVKNLSYKTGIDENELKAIVTVINHLPEQDSVSPGQLVTFHKQLESFYKTA